MTDVRERHNSRRVHSREVKGGVKYIIPILGTVYVFGGIWCLMSGYVFWGCLLLTLVFLRFLKI